MPRKAPKYEGVKPNYPPLRRSAEQKVLHEMGQISRPEDRIVRAVEIVRQADAEIGAHLGDRNAALASLYLYDHLEGASLADAVGVNKNALRKVLAEVSLGDSRAQIPPHMSDDELTQFAKKHKVRHIPDAAERLAELGRIIEKAKARRGVAVRVMQDTILVLNDEPYGWKPERIAEHAGVMRDLIYKQRAAARKRHGL
ncbi:hypothetical protein [Streptomyces glaucescens]|uniref:Uncharacterized protein n=1 Tax=Streptomyces glaucescens TaxID=1907 RepID=A0A089XMY0_STRGA|nr:hypothetical protein [Streptomyces glaucescens]AIS02590.1 hypothetical protein SGLAU_33310 [Streptomyces glaucescens]